MHNYPTNCYRCGMWVGPEEAHFEKHPGFTTKRKVQHTDCAIRWRGRPPPPIKEARLAHEAYVASGWAVTAPGQGRHP